MFLPSSNTLELKTLLFIGEEVTLSHVVRLIALATPLSDDPRFRIVFACGTRYRDLVEQAGLTWHPIATLSYTTFARRLRFAVNALYRYRELRDYVEADMTIVREIRPDLIISDFRLSLDITARRLHIPHINLADGYWSPASSLPYPQPENYLTSIVGHSVADRLFPLILPVILWLYQRPITRLYRHYKLTPPPSQRAASTQGTIVLYPDIPSVTPVTTLPPGHAFLGPVFWEPSLPLPDWLETSASAQPLIYISFGSSGNTDIFPLLFDILGQRPVRVIVSTAGRPVPGTPPENFCFVPYVPALRIIERSALVICHGGNVVAYQAFRHGIPVLGIPDNIAQYFSMERIAEIGAGILLRPSALTQDSLATAIDALLKQTMYTKKSKELQKEILTYDSHKIFLETIQVLLRKPCPASPHQSPSYFSSHR